MVNYKQLKYNKMKNEQIVLKEPQSSIDEFISNLEGIYEKISMANISIRDIIVKYDANYAPDTSKDCEVVTHFDKNTKIKYLIECIKIEVMYFEDNVNILNNIL